MMRTSRSNYLKNIMNKKISLVFFLAVSLFALGALASSSPVSAQEPTPTPTVIYSNISCVDQFAGSFGAYYTASECSCSQNSDGGMTCSGSMSGVMPQNFFGSSANAKFSMNFSVNDTQHPVYYDFTAAYTGLQTTTVLWNGSTLKAEDYLYSDNGVLSNVSTNNGMRLEFHGVNHQEYDIPWTVSFTARFSPNEIIKPADCAGNFEYSYDDWIDSIVVHADEPVNESKQTIDGIPDTLVTYEAGEWYAFDVELGYQWYDDGAGDPRFDLEFAWDNGEYDFSPPVWHDLNIADELVACITPNGDINHYIAFVQATDEHLLLRVNDENLTFEPNTEAMLVSVYHAIFHRPLSGCEESYRIAGYLGQDTIEANQEDGKLAMEILPVEEFGGVAVPQARFQLERNSWYSIRTSKGPWQSLGDTLDVPSFDLEIRSNNTENGWEPLEEWSEAACIVETDSLGHLIIYFQTPDLLDREYELRVADTENWLTNTGSMTYSIYEEIELASCDFQLDEELASGVIPGDASLGVQFPDLDPNGEGQLTIFDTYYAVTILDESAWQDTSGGQDLYTAEITANGGLDWYPLLSYPSLICSEQNGDETTIYITGQSVEDDYWLRVDSDTFGDNTGELHYKIFSATEFNPYAACLDEYNLDYLAETGIPVKEDDGINIFSEYSMVPGYTYGLQTKRGPWFDDEDDQTNTQSYVAEVSPDGGTTWYPLLPETNLPNTCISIDAAKRYSQFVWNVEDATEMWLIRVGDENGDFINNGGNLFYELYQAENAGYITDVPVLDAACYGSCLMPENYLDVGGWLSYLACYIKEYFAWCPRHTDVILGLGAGVSSREPFATLAEISTVMSSVEIELNSYQWEDSTAEESALSSANATSQFDDHFLHTDPGGPWRGGDLINFSTSVASTAYMTSCSTALEDILSTQFQQGICFITYQTKVTGFSFWLQILVDVVAVAVFLGAAAKFSKSVGWAVR